METSIVVFVFYSLITMVFPIASGSVLLSTLIWIVLLIFVFGLVGYNVFRKRDKNLNAAKVGAWAGALMGLISAIVGILTYYLFPARIQEVLSQAVRAGASAELTTTMVQIGLYLNLILLPIIYALMGALITWLGFLIFKKKK